MELLEFIEEPANTINSNNIDNKNTTDAHLEEALSKLHHCLNEENATSDYCTWYLRVMTASQIKAHTDRYLPFLLADESSSTCLGMDGMIDIPMYCAREVEGMVQVAALAESLGVRVVIEYMDGRVMDGDGGEVVYHVFGENNDNDNDQGGDSGDKQANGIATISLLYRPGHYDILYRAL